MRADLGLIQSLLEKHINVVEIKPDRDKQSRLISQIDLFEGGSVLLPKDAPWLDAFVSELLSFPAGMVDALSQGLAWYRQSWKAAGAANDVWDERVCPSADRPETDVR